MHVRRGLLSDLRGGQGGGGVAGSGVAHATAGILHGPPSGARGRVRRVIRSEA